jgi:hypothetical protein
MERPAGPSPGGRGRAHSDLTSYGRSSHGAIVSTSEQLASASASGIAAAYAHIERLDKAEALAEVDQALAQYRIPPVRRTAVLTEAAAVYVRPREADWWYGEALDLLVEAGADRELAERIRDDRPPGLFGR